MIVDLIEKLNDKPLPPTPMELSKLEKNKNKNINMRTDEDKVLMNLEQGLKSLPPIPIQSPPSIPIPMEVSKLEQFNKQPIQSPLSIPIYFADGPMKMTGDEDKMLISLEQLNDTEQVLYKPIQSAKYNNSDHSVTSSPE
eukprot:483958_1